MKKLPLSLFILTLLCIILLPFGNVEARQGCCSHHGGVCGCSCCDGTSLSATCAPYYPQCSQPVKQEPPTPTTPVSPKSESEIPKNNLPTQTYNPNEYTAQASKKTSSSVWWVILGLGIGGFITYLFLKRKK